MSNKILVVEDEPDILGVVGYNLTQAGFEVDTAEDGETGLKKATGDVPDLVILDLMLPGIDGFEVCRVLKQTEATKEVPVLMLTAKAEEVDRIVGLELGADDYVVKPFSPRELILRVKAILRRATAPRKEPDDEDGHGVIEAGPLRIDPAAYRAVLRGQPLQLTATEFRLLLVLAQRRGRVQSRRELLDVVWKYEYQGYARTVDTHVRRLREKLRQDSDLVETVRGIGYRFRSDVD